VIAALGRGTLLAGDAQPHAVAPWKHLDGQTLVFVANGAGEGLQFGIGDADVAIVAAEELHRSGRDVADRTYAVPLHFDRESIGVTVRR